jgi:HEPN domain-containing protein
MKDLKQEASRWLRQAESDLELLGVVRAAGKHDTCCFLAQQAAEKALKAFLFSRGEELIFTHSVFRLCQMAAQYDPAWEALRDRVKQLDFYYVEARYPNALEDTIPAEFFTDTDSAEAIGLATLVVESVKASLAG